MAKQTVPPLPLRKHWPRRVRSAARGQILRAIQRGPYLILAGVFPLEAFAASFPAQPMVEMTQILPFTFGGLVHQFSDFTFGGPLHQYTILSLCPYIADG